MEDIQGAPLPSPTSIQPIFLLKQKQKKKQRRDELIPHLALIPDALFLKYRKLLHIVSAPNFSRKHMLLTDESLYRTFLRESSKTSIQGQATHQARPLR
jgi:hypothetical protein